MTIQLYSGSQKPSKVQLHYEIYENELKERNKISKSTKNVKVFIYLNSSNLHISQLHLLFNVIRLHKIRHLKSMDNKHHWSSIAKRFGLKVIDN